MRHDGLRTSLYDSICTVSVLKCASRRLLGPKVCCFEQRARSLEGIGALAVRGLRERPGAVQER